MEKHHILLSSPLAALRTARALLIYTNRLEISSKFLSGLSFESCSGGEELSGYLESGKKPQGFCFFSLTNASNTTLGKQLLFFVLPRELGATEN